MSKSDDKEFVLSILEAYTRDVGRNIVRLDYDTMDAMNVNTGQTLLLKGKKEAVAKALPLYPSDEGKKLLRIDGLLRTNLGVSVGEKLTIKKIQAKHAEVITVRAIEAIPPIDELYIAQCLDSTPVMKDQDFVIPYFGGRLNFVVEDTTPKGAVIVSELTTKVIINTESLPKQILAMRIKIIQEQNSLIENLKKQIESDQPIDLDQLSKNYNSIKVQLSDYAELYEIIKLMYQDQEDVISPKQSPISKNLKNAILEWHKSKEKKDD